MVRFYTLPPSGIEHKYIFVNPRSIKELEKRQFVHAICDSGVHFFYDNPEAEDYPSGYIDRYMELAKKLAASFGDKIWITIPDYPDDYHPGQFGDNVEKTLVNIRRFAGIENVLWMPTIQANFKDMQSFRYSCKQLRRMKEFERVAIGTVCKVRDLEFISRCCRTARRFFPKSWIHAFGPSLNAIPYIKYYIDSFDSTAWTFPRTPNNHSCKTAREREEYFLAYLSRLEHYLELPSVSILDFVS